MATNENDEFPRFLETASMRRFALPGLPLQRHERGAPSNLARFFDLYGGTVDRGGRVWKRPDREEMQRRIFSVSVSDEETRRTIRRVYDAYKVVLEPHGAVGWKGLEAWLTRHGDFPLCVSLEDRPPGQVSRRRSRRFWALTRSCRPACGTWMDGQGNPVNWLERTRNSADI